MLAAPPFHHFLVSIADTDPSEEYPTVTRFIKLMKEYYQHSSKASSQAVAPQTVQRGVWSVPVAQTRAASSFTPDMFYDLLKRFNPIGSGWQEDSQEFLCFLLDSLHNELVAGSLPPLPRLLKVP
jgi:ubiquitin C-terminal hydrolase